MMTWYDTKDKVPEKRGDSIVYLNNKKQVKQLIFDWDEAFVRDNEEEMKSLQEWFRGVAEKWCFLEDLIKDAYGS